MQATVAPTDPHATGPFADPQAFGDLFERHAPDSYGFCFRRTGDGRASDDRPGRFGCQRQLAAWRTRTATRAGRVGSASERKSRTAARCRQKPHEMGSPGDMAPGPGRTGASQAGHASVPVASRHELAARCDSWRPDNRSTG